MASPVQTKAAKIAPPRSGTTQKISATTTAATTALIAALKPDTDQSVYVRVKVTGGTCWILFGDSSVTVDATATSGATLGWPMLDGNAEFFELSDQDTHIACDAVTNVTVAIYRVTQ